MRVSVSIETKTARSTCVVLVDAAPDAVAVAVAVGAAAAETVLAYARPHASGTAVTLNDLVDAALLIMAEVGRGQCSVLWMMWRARERPHSGSLGPEVLLAIL